MLPAGTDHRSTRSRLPMLRLPLLATFALPFLTLALLTLAWPLYTRNVLAADSQAGLVLAPHGTPFYFEVIDSHDAKYQGDTPAHLGKDGGLTVRPNVALGDPVYRTVNKATTVIGKVTLVLWDRVSGSLTVEFDPEPDHRIAVGDEVWVDLNPAPTKPGTPGPTAP
jgi:hypothetical protein